VDRDDAFLPDGSELSNELFKGASEFNVIYCHQTKAPEA